METTPKAKRGLCRTALQVFEWQLEYHVLDSLQAPFAYAFWLIEQRKARLQDRLENERSRQ
jgi:hypothetical protein